MFCTLGGHSMTISPVSSKNPFTVIQPDSTPAWVRPSTYSIPQIQMAEAQRKKQEKQQQNKKYILSGTAGLVILAIAVAKRKAIGKFFKNIFKKEKPQTPSPAAGQVKPKIELPKPNFTVGKENPEQYAKEKAEYITGIWDEFLDVNPPYKPVNKEKNILGLQALQKYGTREDMLKLNDEYQLSKDSDIMKEYAKLVGNVGITKDALPLRAKTNKKKINLYNESTIEEIMKTLKKLMVDKAEKGYFVNASYSEYKDFERLSKHPNKSISDNARAIMKRISDENPWMLE